MYMHVTTSNNKRGCAFEKDQGWKYGRVFRKEKEWENDAIIL